MVHGPDWVVQVVRRHKALGPGCLHLLELAYALHLGQHSLASFALVFEVDPVLFNIFHGGVELASVRELAVFSPNHASEVACFLLSFQRSIVFLSKLHVGEILVPHACIMHVDRGPAV